MWMGDGNLDKSHELIFAGSLETLALEVLSEIFVLGNVTDMEDDSEIEGRCCKAERVAVVGEGVGESGGGGVGCLTGVADDTGGGREHEEEVEFLWELVVQIPCSLYFGSDRCFVVCESHVLEKRVLIVLANLSDGDPEKIVLLVKPLRPGPRHELEGCLRTRQSQTQRPRYR